MRYTRLPLLMREPGGTFKISEGVERRERSAAEGGRLPRTHTYKALLDRALSILLSTPCELKAEEVTTPGMIERSRLRMDGENFEGAAPLLLCTLAALELVVDVERLCSCVWKLF